MILILGALILLAGIAVDRWWLSRGSRKPNARLPEAVCGCSHHLSSHDPGTGACHDAVQEETAYNSYGSAVAWKPVPCPCRKYVGPEPLDGYFATEISA